ncbi:TPA: DNA-3-methyladenine glycosylase 2 family protein [Clostridioides difficile]|nr:DNA-3-methyladenine glycosylase 2 family protein [Clostridioides difficile]
MNFIYSNVEIEYLKNKDKILSDIIDKIGHIEREIDTDLFLSVIHHIIVQQISTKAQATIWKRMKEHLKEINASSILSTGTTELQSFGMTYRKAEYLTDFVTKVKNGEFDLQSITCMSDKEVIDKLTSLKGIGIWTAEMILLFCLQRPNILSFDDLAIQRGLRMVYHHRKITRKLFEKYQKRFSPYCSVASLYF